MSTLSIPIMRIGVASKNGQTYGEDAWAKILDQVISYRILITTSAPTTQTIDPMKAIGTVDRVERDGDVVVAHITVFDETFVTLFREELIQFTTACTVRFTTHAPLEFIELLCLYIVNSTYSAWDFPNGEWVSPTTN